MTVSLIGQSTNEISQLIDRYATTSQPVIKYETLVEIMEKDAHLSLKEARQFINKYSEDDARFAITNMVLADVYFYQNLLDSSKYQYLNLSKIAEQADDQLLYMWGYGNAAFIYEQEGRVHEAIKLRKHSRQFSLSALDPRVQSDYYHNVGKLYAKVGLIDSATHYYRQALDIDRKVGNIKGLIHDLHLVIELNLLNKNYGEAVKNSVESIELSQEIEYDRGLATSYMWEAQALLEMKSFEKASSSIEKAIEIDVKRNDLTRMPQNLRVKGDILVAMDNSTAEEVFQKAIDYGKRQQNIYEQCKSGLSLSRYYISRNDFLKAEETLTKISKWNADNALSDITQEYLDQAYTLNMAQGNYQKANKLLEEKEAIVTRELDKLRGHQTENLDQSYDLFRVEREIDHLKFEKEISALQNHRKNIMLFAIVLGLSLTTLLAYFAFQNQKNKTVLLQKTAQEQKLLIDHKMLEKEMDTLRSQMNPHFLFNSLNSINDYVMHQNPKEASIYLTKFSKLMRTILSHSKKKLISLKEELEAVKLYMELENLRFKGKFQFNIEISKKINTDEIKVPPMLIQPFLENAVKHGMKNLDRKGLISLHIEKVDERLYLRIKDNGIGRERATTLKNESDLKRQSYGIDITSDRIKMLNAIYRLDATLNYIDHQNPTGTEVILSLLPKNQFNSYGKN